DQYYDESIQVHGRYWRVIVKPEYHFAPTGGLIPSVAGIGVAFTLMIAAYIFMLRSHSAEMRAAFATQSGELREAQRWVSGVRNDIEEANKAKSVFLATMSHELRTPLTGVIGYIDLLCNKITDPEHRQMMDKLRQAANAQRAIVNDVLDYSRISAGTLKLEREPFKLQDVIDAAVSTYGIIAKDKGVMVGCRVPAGMPTGFIGDPARLQQVVNNLVSNAVKFTHKGSVTVYVTSELRGDNNCSIEICVEDTGIGIAPDQIENLFDPFVHTENVTTREFGGTGLGLSICKEIAEKMGGSVTVESKKGWGSKFTVSLILPLNEVDKAVEQDNSHKLLFSGVPLRILIVEDYALVREMLSATLEKAGHAVVAVDNGAEAYEAIYSPVGERFDVVLMDMHMPIMDGADAVKRIRSLGGAEAETAIIGMSADVMSEHVQRFVDAGINAFITKPIDWNELGRVMKSVTSADHVSTEVQRPIFDQANIVQPLLIADIFTQFVNALSEEQSSGLYDATVAFFADCEKRLNALDKKPDFEKSQELAHTILGAASTVGAMRVSETAHKLCALEEEPDDLPDRIARLKDLLKKSQIEFDKHFSELKSTDNTLH
ncbi:MAG: ATP-binding protein, partial [Kordiimonas sp.]